MGLQGDPAADPGMTLVKLLRWPHALEQPFHALPDNPLDPTQELDASTRVLFHGHSGVVLEGPSAAPWNADLELQAGFSRGPLPGSPLCEAGVELAVPESRITTDPYTGNLFVGRFGDDRLHLAIFDRSGELLAEIRSDLFFRSPLPDLTGTPRANLDLGQTAEYFWFDPQRLAGFVDVYRRIGGASYARFLVDAFLSELIYRERTGNGEPAGPRLPYLPGPDAAPEVLMPGEIDNLRGLRTTYRQVFIRGKPRKGGVSCALMPVLKMIEDRDCRAAAESSCPSYSAMALQTELFRAHPETMRDRGYALYQVFETLVERGLCSELHYPMLTDVPMGRSKTVEQFGARAERELNRLLSAEQPDSHESLGAFVEQLPPLCRKEMAGYRDAHAMAPHDLVDLLATQEWFDDALSKQATAELMRAQKEELYRLVVQLLGDGLLVGVAGDRGSLAQHAVLAYGWDAEGFLLMDSDLPSETARRRTVMPAGELRRTISGVTFLRDEVAGLRPSARQLAASLEILPDVAWTHLRLAEFYREQDRHREALEHLRRVVELDAGRWNSWLDLGESLQVLGLFEEALEATQQAIAAGGDGRYAQAQLGYSLRKLGWLEQAEQALRVAVNPEHSWEWRQLGWTLFDRGKDEEAEDCFRKAVEIEPHGIWEHVELAQFLSYAGKPEEAREALLSVPRDDFDALERTWIAHWLGFLGQFDDAIPLLVGVLAEAPEIHAARLALARDYRRQGEAGKAAAIVAPLIAVDATGLGERIELAYAQAFSGKTTACRETVATLEKQFPEMEGASRYDLACIQALNGDIDGALDALEAAFQRGFDDYRWTRRDPDLALLSGNPRLKRIFAQYGSHER